MRADLERPELGPDFEILDLLAVGRIASTWRVRDKHSQATLMAKVFDRSKNASESSLYLEHLRSMQAILPAGSIPYLLLPLITGQNQRYTYQIFEFLPGVRDLDDYTHHKEMSISDKFRVIAHIATALHGLHQRGLIHADVKPQNVLVGEHGTDSIWLIDLGMVHASKNEPVLLFSTYAYLHPSLKSFQIRRVSDYSHSRFVAPVGPYIDIYAFGILILELLTGCGDLPSIISPETIRATLARYSVSFSDSKSGLETADLLARMLSVEPNHEGITASEIHDAAMIQAVSLTLRADTNVENHPTRIHGSTDDRDSLVGRLEAISQRLEESALMLIARDGSLKAVEPPDYQEELMNELQRVFDNALRRARVSWRFSLAITLIVFGILVAMIVLAVTLTITTGKGYWAILFGGLSVPSILGVLIWRPYDRLFRATIITQQIELIHIQTTAGVRGTTAVAERTKVFTDAISQLNTLLRENPLAGRAKFSRSSSTLMKAKSDKVPPHKVQ